MPENVLILCENGARMVHRWPLPEGLAHRVAVGEASNLGPCDEDGNLTGGDVADLKGETEPSGDAVDHIDAAARAATVPAATSKPAARRVAPKE